MQMFDLKGKVAIITGAAMGLGQGMALALANAGADIISVGLGDNKDTQKLIEGAGRKFLAIDANLMTIEPINGVIEKVLATFGRIDVLVNCAGTIRRADAIDFTEKDWDDVMDLNLKTLFFFSQAVAK